MTNTRLRTRRLLRALVLASSILAGPAWAQSLPSGGQVVSGSATITQDGNALTIDQKSDKLIANWQSFSIDTGKTVTFNQPTVNSVALNRVIGQDPSKILGALNANGKVFLVNPNGIVIGKEGAVQTGGFVASTLAIKDADFLAGNYRFTGTGGTIENQGSLKGAVVALIAPSVRNNGAITGDTAMAAGSDVLLDFDGDGLLSVEVKGATLATLVENKGLIAAKGGLVVLTAKGASDAMKSVVNNSGMIEAQTIGSKGGRIYLLGDMANGAVEVSGTLDASAPGGGDGGFVETSAAKVHIADGARITTAAPQGRTGTLLIDPHDYRVAGFGDNEDITGTGLTALLLSNNVTIESSAGAASGGGDITLADDVNAYVNTLTLTAARDILIKAELNLLGTSTLVMNTGTANGGEPGVAGGTVKVNIAGDLSGFTGRVSFDRAGAGLLTINGVAYTVIDNIADLQAIATDANARYALGADIDASATSGWNAGKGFAPIANFQGVLDGLGHAVDGLVIARPTEIEVGLFGQMLGTARNLNVSNANIRGGYDSGVFAGYIGGLTHNVLVSGQVRGGTEVGGLAGYAISQVETTSPMLYDVHSSVTVTSTADRAGGLIGFLNQAGMQNVSASGSVTGYNYVGGLVGWAETGTLLPLIQDAHASGNVSGRWYVGGLIASLDGYRLDNVSASGAVTNLAYSGSETVISGFGGLIGRARSTQISGAVASGSVTITGNRDIDAVGGLIGYTNNSTISDASATGAVSVTTQSSLSISHVGGLIGFADLSGASAAPTSLANVQALGNVDVSAGKDASYVGGLVGQANAGLVTQASAIGHVSVASLGNTEYLGGLIGEISDGSVSDAQASGAVSGSSTSGGTGRTRYFGGLIGSSTDSSLTDVSASGNVTLTADHNGNADTGDVGGLLGTGNTVQIVRGTASGDVTANAGRLGGLVGSLYSDLLEVTVSNVSASGDVISTGSVSGSSQQIGGLIGVVADNGSTMYSARRVSIDHATATGSTVSGIVFVGGLVGRFGGVAITSSSATANVTAARSGGGGLLGVLDAGDISDVWASGNVSGGSVGNLGGLIGLAYFGGKVDRAFATGDVTSPGTQIGGLIGYNEVDLHDVFATGNVTGSATVGGLAGYSDGSIYRAYADGAVTSGDATTTGGLVGRLLNGATVTASFYDSQTSGQSDTGKGTGLTSAQMADPFTFIDAGWDFANIWGTPKAGGAPLLREFAGVPLYDYYVRIAGSLSRSYGDANPALSALTLSGVGTGNLLLGWGSAAGATANAGTYGWFTPNLLSYGYAVGNATDYYIAYGSGGLTVTPRVIALSGARTYDRTTDLAASIFTLGNLANGETLTLTGIGQLADKSAGNGRSVSLGSLALGNGTGLASNYTLAGGTHVADIARVLITLSGVTASSRVYDGTLTATLDTSAVSMAGVLAGDAVGFGSATGAFFDKNVGTAKTVVISGGVLTGADAANYAFAPQSGATADITPATISAITGIGGGAKMYDTRTDTDLDYSGATFVGMVAGDQLEVASGTGAFDDKNAGTNKLVHVTGLSLGGVDAGNYILADTTATALGEISKAPLTSVAIAATRAYDGTTTASLDLSSATFDQMFAGDDLTLASGSGAYADAKAGTGKIVTVTGMTLGGADAGNYYLVSPDTSVVGTITRALLTLSGFAAANKVYDGGVTANVASAGTLTGVVGSDSVGFSYGSASFDDKNAATGKTVTLGGIALTGTDAGNYMIAATATAAADITPKTITPASALRVDTKTYDGTTTATLDLGVDLNGVLGGDIVGLVSYTADFADKNAGAGKTVNVTGLALGGADGANYVLASTSVTLTGEITKAMLTLSGVTVADKVYDGTTDATVTSWGTLDGIVGFDDVSIDGGALAFADKNAGTGKAIAFTGSLIGSEAGNYELSVAPITASISRATISAITGITGIGKTYDGTTIAAFDASHAGFTGMIAGDALSVGSGSGFFTDKNAGTGKTLYVFGLTLGGADAANYRLVSTNAVTSADIGRATIAAVTGITAAGKTYDGTTGAALDTAHAGFTGMIAGDALTVASASGSFADKNAGTGKTVNISGLALGGADAGNYVLASTSATASADIARATITAITGITAAGKTYDGTTGAALDTAHAGFTGMIAGDVLAVASASGSFADKNAGTGKTVNISGLALGGADAGNYVLASTGATASADIARATIAAVTGITAAGKTYDGTTGAALDTTHAGFTGMVAGDLLTVASASGSFADKNAGTGKTVMITGIGLGGSDAGNYVLASTGATASADIARATITSVAGITAAGKTYDGTTSAALDTAHAGFNGMIAGDALTVASASGSFADKNAGTGKTVNISGLALGGADAGNYVLASTSATASADIGRATIAAVTGITAAGKTYDGTTGAALDTAHAGFNGMIAGDVLTVASASGSFADKNAGTGKTVNISGLALGGADAGNYVLTSTSATASADIARATIGAVTGITAAGKTYDGGTSVVLDTVHAGFTGMIAGDVLAVTGATGAFADKNAGTGKTVNISGLALGGADAGNYVLASTSATASADIARAIITGLGGIVAADKTYDGTVAAVLDLSGATFTGAVAGDALTLSASGSFADKNAGAGKVVTVTGLALGGADAGNYDLVLGSATVQASIARATITGVTGITARDKTYDGTTNAQLDTAGAAFAGMIAGDVLTVSASGSFADKNAGAGKLVNISGLALGGADAGNYVLASTSATASADIARATITGVTGITARDKTYDGTTRAQLDTGGALFAGMIAGDTLTVSASGGFADKNAGTNKLVTITGLALGGADANNYVLAASSAAASATITPALLGVSGIQAANKVYDGTTGATLDLSGAVLSGVIAGDTVMLAGATGSFADKNAGAGKTVGIGGIMLGGADAGNYVLASTSATASADIARATIAAVTGIIANDKTYDGGTAATLDLSGAHLGGAVAGDDLGISATGSFADKNAGASKTVAIGLALTGADASNYVLASADAVASATIRQATISAVTGIVALGKTYDGTTAATLDLTGARFTDAIAGDRLVLASASGTFADRNAGSAKLVNIGGLSLGGADAGNYVLASTGATARADIARAVVTLSRISAASKTYDGTTAATLDVSQARFAGLIAGDSLSVALATGSFADKNAGQGKTVTIAGIGLGGADAGNYVLAGIATATANIDVAVIGSIGGITGIDKAYDGNADARIDASHAVFNGMVAGDQLSVAAGAGMFADALPGTNKMIAISGLALGGADARNYRLASSTATASADIVWRVLAPMYPDQASKMQLEGFDGPSAFLLDDPELIQDLTQIGREVGAQTGPAR
ncbi:YDG domain-containing protein [Sphingomonas sp. KR3-1]|uniref:YDG domain-containing protein n=1 Tax=Sphingomonas sp. KR3-1 TaxID=3156611 RepID=UPI0032B3E894